ncbi:hypothetical protein KUCAC02_005271, partial [Chaenocephalus aceratus]
ASCFPLHLSVAPQLRRSQRPRGSAEKQARTSLVGELSEVQTSNHARGSNITTV